MFMAPIPSHPMFDDGLTLRQQHGDSQGQKIHDQRPGKSTLGSVLKVDRDHTHTHTHSLSLSLSLPLSLSLSAWIYSVNAS
jgi:hypothetical protein